VPSPPRRRISEFFTKLELEPSQFECVVEGDFDRRVLAWVFTRLSITYARATEINDFELPASVFPGAIVPSGNRSRVIRLAELAHESIPEVQALACLVDRDLELLVPADRELAHLVLTMGASLETMFLRPEVLDAVFTGFLRLSPDHIENATAEILHLCRERFLSRTADHILKLEGGALDPESDLSLTNGAVSFDSEQFHSRYCDREGLVARKPAYLHVVTDLRLSSSADVLIHGHDFVDAIRSVAVLRGTSRQLATRANIEGVLLASLGLERLMSDETICEIVDRARLCA
jgi:hypothetical protein